MYLACFSGVANKQGRQIKREVQGHGMNGSEVIATTSIVVQWHVFLCSGMSICNE